MILPEGYVIQTYSALVRGLTETFDLREPSAGDKNSCKTYREICQKTFQQDDVDVMFLEPIEKDGKFYNPYEGADQSKAARVTVLSDFWYLFGPKLENYLEYIESSKIDYVLTLYPLAFNIYKGTILESKLRWLPPTFDPKRFNDWAMPKEYDVGFIGSGVHGHDTFYPERFAFHSILARSQRWRYFTREHPGYGRKYADDDNQVGRGFSRDINRCRSFLASGGVPHLPLARYFETLASASLLFASSPIGAEHLGLVDGETFVAVTPETLESKIEYYLSNPAEEERIRKNGYHLAMERHSCFKRAIDFLSIIEGRGGRP